jgi:hypothetical protein
MEKRKGQNSDGIQTRETKKSNNNKKQNTYEKK